MYFRSNSLVFILAEDLIFIVQEDRFSICTAAHHQGVNEKRGATNLSLLLCP